MRRRLAMFIAGASGLAACASGGSATERTPTAETMRVSGSAGSTSMTLVTHDDAVTSALPMTVDQAWRALPAVYASLGIPVTALDGAKHALGNDGFKLRRQLGKTSLSRYIDCGETQIGPSADSYEVYLTVHSQVVSDGAGGAKVSTLVEALAKPVTFNQDYSRCTTRGTLELRVAEALKAQASK